MYNNIQQDAYGRYYDGANEFGGHGGDYPPKDYDDDRPLLMRDFPLNDYQRQRLHAEGHDLETMHRRDCACPACLLHAMRDE